MLLALSVTTTVLQLICVLFACALTIAPHTLLQCVELKPDWAKGYSRLGAAYYGLEEWDNAIKAYEDGKQ